MRAAQALGFTAVVACLALLPSVLPSYGLVLATRILIFAILAMSLDLLVGYTGLSSLGHAAFLGYTNLVLSLHRSEECECHHGGQAHEAHDHMKTVQTDQ